MFCGAVSGGCGQKLLAQRGAKKGWASEGGAGGAIGGGFLRLSAGIQGTYSCA